MANPVWRDYYVSFGNVDSMAFSVSVDGNTIFSGTAYRKPGESVCKAKVNGIAGNFLYAGEPTDSGNVSSLSRTFTVTSSAGSQTVTFDYDWSYSSLTLYCLSRLIREEASSAYPMVFSFRGQSSVKVTGYAGNTVAETQTYSYSGASNLYLDLTGEGDWSYYDKYTIQPLDPSGNVLETLTVKGAGTFCGSKVLYYVNPWGGWDWLPIYGTVKESEAYTRYTHVRTYDNTDAMEGGKADYLNEVTRKWSLVSGWLTDSQSARMPYLTGSPKVYLYDTATAIFTPVTITDASVTKKTYRGEGRKMVSYTIGVESEREEVRR